MLCALYSLYYYNGLCIHVPHCAAPAVYTLQVFYVVPRISDIDQTAGRLKLLAPKAKIVVGHSQIDDLEERVLNFTLGVGDILLATSIIENGIDMPNVNSIIIQDSYMFGQ
jgi:transcription-repair coupling factor (superfamily II helicase)